MKNITTIASIICTILCSYLVIEKVTSKSAQKTGVVQMDKLVYEFKGMKEATNRYSEKMKSWSNQSDSMESRLSALYQQIRIDSVNQNKAKLERDIKSFMVLKQSYAEYMNKLQNQAQEEDKEMTLGVVNQVNQYLKNYAEKNGYDVILTNTQQQSVGYVKNALDITDELLEYANNQYEGKK